MYMKRYTRKKTGGSSKSGKFSIFDVVKVFSNKQDTGSYEMAVLISTKHEDGTYTVQFQDGSQGDIPQRELVLVSRFHRTPQEIENLHKQVIRYTLLFKKTDDALGDIKLRTRIVDTEGVRERRETWYSFLWW